MANVILGVFSPFRFELPEYLGYNISILRDNIRFLEVIINRGGSPGGIIGLYFNGKCNFFEELPLPTSAEIQQVYSSLRNNNSANTSKISMFTYTNNNKKQLQKRNIFSKFAALYKKLTL